MPMNSDSSSSLRVLEQHNRSRSTVGSSDTDVDSIGYASSSGTTTPEDDTQAFHLGPTLDKVLAETPTSVPREKHGVAAKHRNLSSAVKRVKKVAHAVFRKKVSAHRSDDVSPSPLRERFGRRMAVKAHPEEGFYSLPNRRFSFPDARTPYHEQGSITRKFGTISGSASGFSKDALRTQRSGPRMPSFSDLQQRGAAPSSISTPAVRRTAPRVWTFETISLHVLRVLLFMPWCAAVGGALLLFPSSVERVAFGPGYLPSPKGLRRFAHWAECGQQHVLIFLAGLVVVVWYDRAWGVTLTSLVLARVVYVWHDFKVDPRISLGEDDQQSLYLVVVGLASVEGAWGQEMVTKADASE